MARNWSLKEKAETYYNEDDNGNFKIRICQECFGTYKSSEKVCPYCGAVYEVTPVEIQNFKEIELKKIEEAKAIKMQKWREALDKKVTSYKGPQECKSWGELLAWCRYKGYKTRLCVRLEQTVKIKF